MVELAAEPVQRSCSVSSEDVAGMFCHSTGEDGELEKIIVDNVSFTNEEEPLLRVIVGTFNAGNAVSSWSGIPVFQSALHAGFASAVSARARSPRACHLSAVRRATVRMCCSRSRTLAHGSNQRGASAARAASCQFSRTSSRSACRSVRAGESTRGSGFPWSLFLFFT